MSDDVDIAKLLAEREKLFQEVLKLERQRVWYVLPLVTFGNAILAAIIAAVITYLWR
jgi:hypothetical protein